MAILSKRARNFATIMKKIVLNYFQTTFDSIRLLPISVFILTLFANSAIAQPFQGYEVSGVHVPVTTGWTSGTRDVHSVFYTNSSGDGISKEIELTFNSANINAGDSIIILSDTAGFEVRSIDQSTGWLDVIEKTSVSDTGGSRNGFVLSAGQTSLKFDYRMNITATMASAKSSAKSLFIYHMRKTSSGVNMSDQIIRVYTRILAASNVYRWTGELSKDFHDDDNWMPKRTTVSSSDKLIFDHIGVKECEIKNNGTKVVQTIDQLMVNHYTDIMFTNYRNNGDNSVSTLKFDDVSTNLPFFTLEEFSNFGSRYDRGSGAGDYDLVFGGASTVQFAGTDTITFHLTNGTHIQAVPNVTRYPIIETINDKGNGAVFKLYSENSITNEFDLLYLHVNCELNTTVMFDGNSGVSYSMITYGGFSTPSNLYEYFGGAGKVVISPRVSWSQTNSDGAFSLYLGGTLEVYGSVVGKFISNSPTANTESAWNAWSPYIKIMNNGTNAGRIGSQLKFGSSVIDITGGVEWQMYNSGNRAWRTVGFPFSTMHVSQIARNIVITGTKDATNKDSFYSFNSTCTHCKTSLYAWDEGTSAWSGFESGTTANKIDAGDGVLLFFRGLGSSGLGDASASASAGVMSFKGTPVVGSKTLDLTYNSNGGSLKGVNLVANPYMSNVDWNALTRTNVADKFYFYDPAGKMYNTYDNTGSSVVVNGTNAYKAGTTLETRTIEQGAAFFAIATGSSASITFDEEDKIATKGSASAFREDRTFPCNRLSMSLTSQDAAKKELDHATLEWDMSEKGASATGDFMDMPKIYGGYYGIGTVDAAGEWYVIDRRPDLESGVTETVNMRIASHEKNGAYRMSFEMCGEAPSATVVLVDRLKGTKTPVEKSTVYEFTMNESDALKGDRFALELLKSNGQMGVAEIQNAVSVYPNPAKIGSDIFLAVANGHEIEGVALHDLNGRVLHNWKAEGRFNNLKLPTNLNEGIYILTIKTTQGVQQNRVLLSKP